MSKQIALERRPRNPHSKPSCESFPLDREGLAGAVSSASLAQPCSRERRPGHQGSSNSRITSRAITSLLIVLIVVLVVVGLSGFSPRGSAQQASATATNRNAAVVAATSEVLKETSALRELAILRPVRSGAQSRAEIERMLIRKLNEQMTTREMHDAELALKKFGLAPAGFAYRSFLIKLLTEQVAGYYDPKAREFHLADWLNLDGQKPVMAHELTHALQDQHFNLQRFEKWPRGDSDAELAAHALVEGDATLAMTAYMTRNPLIALAFARSIQSGLSTEQFDLAPRALRETLIFPYLQGMAWATYVHRKGGWSLVSKAYTRLPQSTEQILHPEKYFSNEAPVKVVLPDLTGILNSTESNQQSAISNQQTGARSRGQLSTKSSAVIGRQSSVGRPTPRSRNPTPAKWSRVEHDVNGEWGYYLILDEYLKSLRESRRAAAGWAGDRYALYEGSKPGQLLLVHVSAWDTEDDAREFFDAYVKRTALRYPGAKLLNDTGHPAPDTRHWQTSEGRVVVELRGRRVLMIEGIPEGVELNSLTSTPW